MNIAHIKYRAIT